MAGNVWEWTSSYRDHPRSSSRIVRGASFLERHQTVWARDFQPPTQNTKGTLGFRCVVDAK
jgi:formylglycine-generating enzyme required for sulfatase activity